MRKNFLRRAALWLAAAGVLLTYSCSSVIQEDAVRENLPAIDPTEGVTQTITAQLYYRLCSEPYLVPVSRTLSVHASERAEVALAQALLQGGAPGEDLSLPFPAGTKITDGVLEGGILYLTLSREFLDDSGVREIAARRENMQADAYQQALSAATEELYATRRMGAYALVNTVAGYNADIQVQLLVEHGDTGAGARLTLEQLGLSTADAKGAAELLEPLGFNADAVAVPQTVVYCALSHLKAQDYACAHSLFLKAGVSGDALPALDTFAALLAETGTLADFRIVSEQFVQDSAVLHIGVDLSVRGKDGTLREVSGAQLLLKEENYVYRIDFAALAQAMRG